MQSHPWFPVEMMSKEQTQKFHTSDRSLHDLGSASDWLKQISLAAQTIRKTSHHYEISALVTQMLFCGEISGGIVKCLLFPSLFPLWDSEKCYVI